jgi:hypothetical protein
VYVQFKRRKLCVQPRFVAKNIQRAASFATEH